MPANQSEERIRQALLQHELDFQQHVAIGPYEADFVVAGVVVVEVDGYHHVSRERTVADARKSNYLRQQGFEVIRIAAGETHFPDARQRLLRMIENTLDTVRTRKSHEPTSGSLSPATLNQLQDLRDHLVEASASPDTVETCEHKEEDLSDREILLRYLDEQFPER